MAAHKHQYEHDPSVLPRPGHCPTGKTWKILKEGEKYPKYVEADHKDDALRIAYPKYKWIFCIRKIGTFFPCWVYSGNEGWAEVYEQ